MIEDIVKDCYMNIKNILLDVFCHKNCSSKCPNINGSFLSRLHNSRAKGKAKIVFSSYIDIYSTGSLTSVGIPTQVYGRLLTK